MTPSDFPTLSYTPDESMLLVQARAHHADVALLPLLVPDLQLRLLEDVDQAA